MRPHLQLAVAIDGQAAGWPDRSVRDVHSCVGRLITGAHRFIRQWRTERLIDRRLLQQPARLFLERVDRIDPVPGDMAWRHRSGGIDRGLIGAENGDEIAVTDDLDRPFCGTADRSLVDAGDCAAAPRLAYDP